MKRIIDDHRNVIAEYERLITRQEKLIRACELDIENLRRMNIDTIFDLLPDEVLYSVTDWLDKKSVGRFGATCWRMNETSKAVIHSRYGVPVAALFNLDLFVGRTENIIKVEHLISLTPKSLVKVLLEGTFEFVHTECGPYSYKLISNNPKTGFYAYFGHNCFHIVSRSLRFALTKSATAKYVMMNSCSPGRINFTKTSAWKLDNAYASSADTCTIVTNYRFDAYDYRNRNIITPFVFPAMTIALDKKFKKFPYPNPLNSDAALLAQDVINPKKYREDYAEMLI